MKPERSWIVVTQVGEGGIGAIEMWEDGKVMKLMIEVMVLLMQVMVLMKMFEGRASDDLTRVAHRT